MSKFRLKRPFQNNHVDFKIKSRVKMSTRFQFTSGSVVFPTALTIPGGWEIFYQEKWIQCITRFVDTRFVDKTRFVDGFLEHEKSTNRVLGGFHKTKWKIYFSTKSFLIEDTLICPQNPIDSHFDLHWKCDKSRI